MSDKTSETNLRRQVVGEFLRTARQRVGLTQNDLSSGLGYSTPQLVSNWERGVCLPPTMALPRLSQLIDVKPKRMITQLCRYHEEVMKLRFAQITQRFQSYDKGR